MLSWIPLLGPIIQGLTSIFTKWQDTKLATYQTTRSSDIEEAKVSAQIIQTTQDDILLRIMRDAAILPVVVWMSLIGWDTIIALRFPEWKFSVASYPDNVGYIPYVVIVFLFGNIGLNMWNRR